MNRTEEKLAALNQPKPWSGINAYRADPLLVDLTSSLSRPLRDEYDVIGKYVTSPEAQELARMANASPPQLRTHGVRGERPRSRRVPSRLARPDAPLDGVWPAFLRLGKCTGSARP